MQSTDVEGPKGAKKSFYAIIEDHQVKKEKDITKRLEVKLDKKGSKETQKR